MVYSENFKCLIVSDENEREFFLTPFLGEPKEIDGEKKWTKNTSSYGLWYGEIADDKNFVVLLIGNKGIENNLFNKMNYLYWGNNYKDYNPYDVEINKLGFSIIVWDNENKKLNIERIYKRWNSKGIDFYELKEIIELIEKTLKELKLLEF